MKSTESNKLSCILYITENKQDSLQIEFESLELQSQKKKIKFALKLLVLDNEIYEVPINKYIFNKEIIINDLGNLFTNLSNFGEEVQITKNGLDLSFSTNGNHFKKSAQKYILKIAKYMFIFI